MEVEEVVARSTGRMRISDYKISCIKINCISDMVNFLINCGKVEKVMEVLVGDFNKSLINAIPAAKKVQYNRIMPKFKEKLNKLFGCIVATGNDIWVSNSRCLSFCPHSKAEKPLQNPSTDQTALFILMVNYSPNISKFQSIHDCHEERPAMELEVASGGEEYPIVFVTVWDKDGDNRCWRRIRFPSHERMQDDTRQDF
ncbi:hypothetical protein IEQ34_009431 [Dendrobium chrysotoxum]|uniref:Uncharacterized protein n=1 Tax=Dendrobium chrysotoxum TaxID=161865 RepID=A0AAV7H0D6_DENCH|nr:hypothetical protein IEQ34_009431 [Dendrobium chrysotoxum]